MQSSAHEWLSFWNGFREEREKIRLEAEELRKRKAEIDAEIAASEKKGEELAGERRETTPTGDGGSADPPPTPDMKTKLQKYREEKAQAAAEAIRRRKVEERQRRLQQVEGDIEDVKAKMEVAKNRITVYFVQFHVIIINISGAIVEDFLFRLSNIRFARGRWSRKMFILKRTFD